MSLHLLENVVQPYAWGSRTALPELLRLPHLSGTPQAELWMGAHPGGSSRFAATGESLCERIASEPELYLGRAVVERFGGRLPFLFKVLAAEQPLSLQAHPTEEQGRAGYAREQAAGLALDAPTRNYKDEHHKPELLCAMTPFWALCGFRKGEDALALARGLRIEGMDGLLAKLERRPTGDDMAEVFRGLFELPPETRHQAIRSLLRGAQAVLRETPRAVPLARSQLYWAARWSLRLGDLYADDPGVLAALLLNIVVLEPGEAMFLPAGQLHAYLGGVGLEIMASSDNVLRGGLTPKHVDVDELLRVLSFEPHLPDVFGGEVHEKPGCREVGYPAPAAEFHLSRLWLDGSVTHSGGVGPEILLCLEGAAELRRGDETVDLTRGSAVFCAAAPRAFEMRGSCELARARVGNPSV